MRKITSIVLALAFILLAITGVQMSGGGGGRPPQGDVKSSVVQSQGVAKDITASSSQQSSQKSFYPKQAHEWGGYIFIIAGLVHLGLNIKPLMSYVKIKS